jgi:serine/threonine protein kinase
MDFGLATLLDQSLSQLTQPRTRMGTPAYMSPEQAMAGLLEVAERSDIYSAGATLYHMLTGRPPFLGAPDLVYHHVINTPPNPPSNYCHDLDPKLETICLTAMAKNPRERYRSSQEFAVRLREWLKALPHTQKPRSIRPVTPAHEEVSSLLRQSTLFLMDNARKEPLPPFVQEVTRAPGWRRLKIGALMLGVLLLAAALVAWSGLLPGGGQSNKPKGEGLFRNMNDNRPR